MSRVKERWDTKFSTVVRIIDCARRFRNKRWGRPVMENDEVATAQIYLPKDLERRHLEWKIEMKVTL